MQMTAAEYIYWPNIRQDITRYVQDCAECQTYRRTQKPEPLMPHGIPTHAWTKVGSDLFFFKQHKYLLAVDYYLNWPVLVEVPNTGTPATIEAFEQIFADYGIPKELITDTGTNYTLKLF